MFQCFFNQFSFLTLQLDNQFSFLTLQLDNQFSFPTLQLDNQFSFPTLQLDTSFYIATVSPLRQGALGGGGGVELGGGEELSELAP